MEVSAHDVQLVVRIATIASRKPRPLSDRIESKAWDYILSIENYTLQVVATALLNIENKDKLSDQELKIYENVISWAETNTKHRRKTLKNSKNLIFLKREVGVEECGRKVIRDHFRHKKNGIILIREMIAWKHDDNWFRWYCPELGRGYQLSLAAWINLFKGDIYG